MHGGEDEDGDDAPFFLDARFLRYGSDLDAVEAFEAIVAEEEVEP